MTQVRDTQNIQRAAASLVDTRADAAAHAPGIPRALSGLDVIEVRKALSAPMTAAERARIFLTPLGDPGLVPVLDAARRGLRRSMQAWARP